jgi:hypothetical protein
VIKSLNFLDLVRIASKVGEFIDRITPNSHAKIGGSMMMSHSTPKDD